MNRRDTFAAGRAVPPFTQAKRWDRWEFVKGLAAVAGSAGLLGYDLRPAAAEPPPETTRIRLVKVGLCVAPQYVAEELLRTEDFTDLQYIPDTAKVGTSEHLATGLTSIWSSPLRC